MASWGAPAPAYAPGPPSHSRSPRRRDSYPDSTSTYPVTGAPAEWDDHRKSWDEYYDRRATGRSRSPVGEEATRKRRRSASPYERDRFDPRPRYGDDFDTHSRSYGYTSPRRSNYHGAPPASGGGRRPPLDPYAMETAPASLRQFAEWFRFYYPNEAKEEDNADRLAEKEAGKRTRDGIRARWEKYKKQHTANQLQTLFDHHKKSPWFSEKYNPAPEWANLRARVRKQGWRGRPEQFLRDLEEGKYDLKPESEATAEKEDEKEVVQDEVKAADEMEAVEDDAAEPVSPTKSEANGKSIAQERARRDDEVLIVPDGLSMAIRTIPPDIGRQKIEEACRSVSGFLHLALGEPLQKKNYYRAGWIKFKEESDMQAALQSISEKKIEGFKLHVHHVARPFYTRMRIAAEVASTPERLEKDLQQAKRLAVLLEDEYALLRSFKDGAPEPKIEEANRKQHNGKDGDVAMSDVAAPDAEPQGSDAEVEADLEPLERGSEAVERRIEKLVEEMQQKAVEGDAGDAALEVKKMTLALDLYLAYLRTAFNTCYYCAAVCDHLEELQRKCPKHVRKPLSEKPNVPVPTPANEGGEEKEEEEKVKEKEREREKERDPKDRNDRRWERNDERWQEWTDSKIALLINRSGIDNVDYGAKSYEEELTKAVEPHTKQEDEGKFRCRMCQKLFKATAFVEKHVANKHPEVVRQLEDIPFYNNFVLDPHHIQPFSHLPPATGNSAAPPPQAYGLQGMHGGGMYGIPADYARAMQNAAGGFFMPYAPYPNGGAHGDYYPPLPAQQQQQQQQQPHWGAPAGRRQDEPAGRRRLQERMGGYAHASAAGGLPVGGVEGLPPKPAEPQGQSGGRRGRSGTGAPPPPPPDAKEDPRAAGGKRVSYHDMDDVAEGDVELTY